MDEWLALVSEEAKNSPHPPRHRYWLLRIQLILFPTCLPTSSLLCSSLAAVLASLRASSMKASVFSVTCTPANQGYWSGQMKENFHLHSLDHLWLVFRLRLCDWQPWQEFALNQSFIHHFLDWIEPGIWYWSSPSPCSSLWMLPPVPLNLDHQSQYLLAHGSPQFLSSWPRPPPRSYGLLSNWAPPLPSFHSSPLLLNAEAWHLDCPPWLEPQKQLLQPIYSPSLGTFPLDPPPQDNIANPQWHPTPLIGIIFGNININKKKPEVASLEPWWLLQKLLPLLDKSLLLQAKSLH